MLKVTLLLADHAEVADGKLFINGGGWSVTGPDPCSGAIAMDVKVPWDERTHVHNLHFELVDADGQPVLVPTPHGLKPCFIEGTLELEGDFEGIKAGTPIDAPFAINYAAIPLAPGGRYEWRLTVNGHADENWTLPFSTRAVEAA
jgi:hypothetical protein